MKFKYTYQYDTPNGKGLSYEVFTLDEIEEGLPLRLCQGENPDEKITIINREIEENE